MNDLVELTVDSIGAGGDGVARHDGLVVFVPRTAPGDLVRVRLDQHGAMARGRDVVVLRPGPGRTTPRCSHYDAAPCGGCQLQHLTMESQLTAKAMIVNDALARIAKRMCRVSAVEASEQAWEYRTKLTLTIREQRGRRSRVIGLRRLGEPDSVFELTECPVTHPMVVAAWNAVGEARDLLPSARTLSGSVRLDGTQVTFVLNGGVRWPTAEAFADACPSLDVIQWRPHGGGGRTIVDRRQTAQPLASFRQVNPAVARRLFSAVVASAIEGAPRSAIDAYAGMGDTAVALSEVGIPVTAIELDAEAVTYAATRLRPPSRVLEGRVEALLPMLPPTDVVILNPPRSGVDAAVTRHLEQVASDTKRVLYVSCNPATLARDVQRLPSYDVRSVQAFDMFPQTAHVETLCELIPAHT